MMYMCLNEICLFFTNFDLNDVYVAVCLQTAFNVDQNDVYVVVRRLHLMLIKMMYMLILK